MAADTVLSRELKSLHEELSASQRQRLSQARDRAVASGEAAARVAPQGDTDGEQRLRSELQEVVNLIKEFVEETEKNASAHPEAAVMGAMVVGILIGRLLGRR